MLAEHHDIHHEFPEFRSLLDALRAKDPQFHTTVARHDLLDNIVRRLEERQQPISDEEFEKMKYERAALKDEIYQALLLASRAPHN